MTWTSQKERGSLVLLKTISWIALAMPRMIARALLYPICVYYIIFFTSPTFTSSKRFWQRLRGKRASVLDVYGHYHSFSANILDKVYFMGNHFEDYKVTIHGGDLIKHYAAQNQGCILMGAHLGNFECMRALGATLAGLKVRPVMYLDNAEKISTLLRGINPEMADMIINLNRPGAMMEVDAAIKRGEMVGILADRLPPVSTDRKEIPATLLGDTAYFPAGPFVLASLLNVPVIFFAGLYRGDLRYDVHFELIAEQLSLPRKNREEALQEHVQHYANILEKYVRLAPDNWFNFYDFWREA
jgi:predicted LPLAT superfamily acyltransferase